MRSACSETSSTPSAIAMRFQEPKRLMATGMSLMEPSSSTGFSKSSALPPPGLFMTRSAISVISSRTATGSRTRTSSPCRSRS